ncbi:hypothetical protein ACV3J7_07145 [Salmonella enterica]
MTFTDKHTGKVYQVRGTTVRQFSGVPFFAGRILNLWGRLTAVTDFKTVSALRGWLEMMGFEEGICS